MREDWVEIQYKDIVKKISLSNKKLKQKEYLQSGKIPVIDQGQELIGGYTDDELKLLDCKLPCIVFGDHTKIVKLINFLFASGADGTKVIEPKEHLEPKLLKYFTEVLALKIKDKGYARHYQDIEKSAIVIPPKLEQKAIVAKIEQLFSELDNGIANLKTAQAKLKIYRQAVLKKAFEGELTKAWREKQTNLPTADELLKQIKKEREEHYKQQLEEWKQAVKEWEKSDEKGTKPKKPKEIAELPSMDIDVKIQKYDLPKNWTWNKVGVLCDVVRGGSPRPAGDKRFYDGHIPFLKVADITNSDSIYLTAHTFTIKEAGLHKTRYLKSNTLLLSNSGATLGVPKISTFEATINDGIAAFLGLNPKRNLFLYYYLSSITKNLRQINQGAAQPNLNTDLIKVIDLPICSLEEQNQIVQEIESRLSVCDKIEETIETSLAKSEALRQSILKKAFEGKILSEQELENIKKHPEYESAEALLKRIKNERDK